jgi:hypothetical protein
MPLTLADRLDIQQVIALYGHILDERLYTRLDELFTEDVVYDLVDFGDGVLHGIDAVRQYWLHSTQHPLAHHATNIVIDEDSDDSVRAWSKGIGVGYKGRVGSAVYKDVFVHTAAGWRIRERVCLLRRGDAMPGS